MGRNNIKLLKQRNEELILKMQFFCLNPEYEVFKKICESTWIQNTQDYFSEWKLACEVKYGFRKFTAMEITKNQAKIEEWVNSMTGETTVRKIDKVWYVFFATGDYAVLEALYESCGSDKLSNLEMETVSDQFIMFIDKYQDKIKEVRENGEATRDTDRLTSAIKKVKALRIKIT